MRTTYLIEKKERRRASRRRGSRPFLYRRRDTEDFSIPMESGRARPCAEVSTHPHSHTPLSLPRRSHAAPIAAFSRRMRWCQQLPIAHIASRKGQPRSLLNGARACAPCLNNAGRRASEAYLSAARRAPTSNISNQRQKPRVVHYTEAVQRLSASHRFSAYARGRAPMQPRVRRRLDSALLLSKTTSAALLWRHADSLPRGGAARAACLRHGSKLQGEDDRAEGRRAS